ncbi:hypothetical protein [Streptomyces sp. NPDC001410]|uniref:hypothetical protein n=1 Tax=Streptomyces sp. NPDC001410 TaxID=3364574 RepID=UPI0036A3DA63
MGSFTHVTKRVVLGADTMLLSEHGTGAVHQLGFHPTQTHTVDPSGYGLSYTTGLISRYGMVTKDIGELGQWLLNAEPLLRSGLVWYCPVKIFGTSVQDSDLDREPAEPDPLPSFSDRSIDFVVEHGRAVDVSRAKPLASRVVRPILEIDLPFINGLSLSDFAQVTSEEFDSYTQYRDFMLSRLLELDDALEAVDSQVALERIALRHP